MLPKGWSVDFEGSRLKTVNKGLEGGQCCLRAGGWRVLPKGWRVECWNHSTEDC